MYKPCLNQERGGSKATNQTQVVRKRAVPAGKPGNGRSSTCGTRAFEEGTRAEGHLVKVHVGGFVLVIVHVLDTGAVAVIAAMPRERVC